MGRLQSAADAFRIIGNDSEVSAGRLIGTGAALFPISERAERDMIPHSKLFLRQLQSTAQGFRARDGVKVRRCFRRKGRIVRVGHSGGFNFLVAHGRDRRNGYRLKRPVRLYTVQDAVSVHSGESKCLFHASWPFGLK